MARALQPSRAVPITIALGLVFALIEIAGDSQCPDAASVQSELARLGATAGGSDGPHRLVITRSAETVSVELVASSGHAIGERSLPAQAECDALASAVAVLVATWESELASGDLPPAIVLRAVPRAATGVAIGALGIVGHRSRGVGATLAANVGPWIAALDATLYERRALGPGQVGWSRAAVRLGGELRWRPGRVAIAVHGEALAGLVHASAHGYDSNGSATGFAPGAAGGVRLQIGNEYVDLGGVAWLQREHLHVAGVAGEVTLPRAELVLAVGVRMGDP